MQQLYNVIDAVVAGRLVNEDALSAIGVSVPIYLLFVSVILGLAIGITILLANSLEQSRCYKLHRPLPSF